MTNKELKKTGFVHGNWMDETDLKKVKEIHQYLEDLGFNMRIPTSGRSELKSEYYTSPNTNICLALRDLIIGYDKSTMVYILVRNCKFIKDNLDKRLTYEEFYNKLTEYENFKNKKFFDNSLSIENTWLDKQLI